VLLNCAVDILFRPSDSSRSNIQLALNAFTGLFPFNLFFDFQDSTQSVLDSSIGGGGSNFSVTLPIIGSVQILTPTIIEDKFGSTTKNKLFEVQRNIMWGIVGFSMIMTVL